MMEFHAPHASQRPDHLVWVPPHSVHLKLGCLAMGVYLAQPVTSYKTYNSGGGPEFAGPASSA